MKRAIISLATDRGNYYKGLCRLGESLRGNTTADFFGFMGEHMVNAPLHQANPYAFKLYAIQLVRSYYEYDQILWLDSSVYAIRHIDHLFEHIICNDYLMQEAGCYVGQWCNDDTLAYAGLNRDQAMTMPCYGNAGMLGINFRSIAGNEFFSQWWRYMEAGMFKGSWADHRHDLTCGSIIANRLGWKFQPGNQILQYAAPTDQPQNDTICLFAQGL